MAVTRIRSLLPTSVDLSASRMSNLIVLSVVCSNRLTHIIGRQAMMGMRRKRRTIERQKTLGRNFDAVSATFGGDNVWRIISETSTKKRRHRLFRNKIHESIIITIIIIKNCLLFKQ